MLGYLPAGFGLIRFTAEQRWTTSQSSKDVVCSETARELVKRALGKSQSFALAKPARRRVFGRHATAPGNRFRRFIGQPQLLIVMSQRRDSTLKKEYVSQSAFGDGHSEDALGPGSCQTYIRPSSFFHAYRRDVSNLCSQWR